MGVHDYLAGTRFQIQAAALVPSWEEERALWAQGYVRVAGVDEVGRGPLAGPVMASAVIFPPYFEAPWLDRLRDSKQLSKKTLAELAPALERTAAVGLGNASPREIDDLGIVEATFLAMRRAVSRLQIPPDFLLVDGQQSPFTTDTSKAIVKGDARCYCIAAASIVAKVHRDRLMEKLDTQYPGYGFADHKGYHNPRHLEALARLGPSLVHRRSFAPVRRLLEQARG